MPIDYSNYPKGWHKEVRPRILARDGHQCRCCGLGNHLWGYRDAGGKFRSLPQRKPAPPGFRAFRILLNVVHLDHALVDHGDHNLGLMCQRCHARYDKPITARQAAYTHKYPGAAATATLPFLS
ncbi:hypothetical protein [Hymenobacter sp. PAMC 26628]|uniref:hypothetical protein n=1 Tax=Hymenobacter sp. PAMC 26628 TaxID=1484118 RepID=UPI0007703032|nr:hypothetical protein [Hymenobacter sp. PAMC 26628]AMJ65026.1 hypothetical protein AXW84_05995 [Hymenobacter sp. PAMC 26628]